MRRTDYRHDVSCIYTSIIRVLIWMNNKLTKGNTLQYRTESTNSLLTGSQIRHWLTIKWYKCGFVECIFALSVQNTMLPPPFFLCKKSLATLFRAFIRGSSFLHLKDFRIWVGSQPELLCFFKSSEEALYNRGHKVEIFHNFSSVQIETIFNLLCYCNTAVQQLFCGYFRLFEVV